MKKYRVIVDGVEYEIGIEPLEASDLKPAEKPAEKQTAPAPATEARTAAAGGERVLSPMPGTILSVRVEAGSSVRKGQVLMILEAMKMENEIISPRDAVVASVNVSGGAAVDTGTLLCVLR